MTYRSLIFVCLLLSGFSALGQTTLRIGIDADNDPATGCGFDPGTGVIQSGVEVMLEVQISAIMPLTISTTIYRICEAGTFGTPMALGSGWPVGINNGINGADVVEAVLPLNLIPDASNVLIHAGAQSVNGADDLSNNFNLAAAIPTLGFWMFLVLLTSLALIGAWTMRRNRLASRASLAAILALILSAFAGNAIVLDGQVNDWLGGGPDLVDATNEPGTTNASDIVGIYICGFAESLFFRFDIVDLENDTTPGAFDDNYFVYGHTTTPVPANLGLLANDAGGMFLAAQAGVFATTNGGQVEIFADGSFNYTTPGPNDPMPPIVGNTDSFTYNITNAPGKMTSATATIEYTRNVYFVDNTAPNGGDGHQNTPFNMLADAETASAEGDIIFIFAGDGTDTGQNQGIFLKDRQDILGQPIGLEVDVDGPLGPALPIPVINPGGTRPVLSAPAMTDVIVAALDNSIFELSLIPDDFAGIGAFGGFGPGPGASEVPQRQSLPRTCGGMERQRIPSNTGSTEGDGGGGGPMGFLNVVNVDINPIAPIGQGIYVEGYEGIVNLTNADITGPAIPVRGMVGPPPPGMTAGEAIFVDSGNLQIFINNITITDMFAGLIMMGSFGPVDAVVVNLTIDTEDGQGMYADGLNSLQVTGTNSISTQNGAALSIYSSYFPAAGVTFETISSIGCVYPFDMYDLYGPGFLRINGNVSLTDSSETAIWLDMIDVPSSFGGSVTVDTTGYEGIDILNCSGDVTFEGPVSITDALDDGLDITDSTGNITFQSTLNITGSGDDGIDMQGSQATTLFQGMVQVIDSAEFGVELNGDNMGMPTGSTTFADTLLIQGATDVGLFVTDIHNVLSFNHVSIAIQNDNAAGVVFDTAMLFGSCTMSDFDLTSTSNVGTVGMDLLGLAGGQIVRFGDADPNGNSSSIAGVAQGIILGALTDAIFTFGDGENVIDTGSTIGATTPVTGLADPVAGSYNLSDAGF